MPYSNNNDKLILFGLGALAAVLSGYLIYSCIRSSKIQKIEPYYGFMSEIPRQTMQLLLIENRLMQIENKLDTITKKPERETVSMKSSTESIKQNPIQSLTPAQWHDAMKKSFDMR